MKGRPSDGNGTSGAENRKSGADSWTGEAKVVEMPTELARKIAAHIS